MCITTFAEEKNLLSMDLFSLSVGELNAKYEKPFSDSSTIEFRGGILYQSINYWQLKGLDLGLGYYVYSNKRLLKEIFYGPSFDLYIISAEYHYKMIDKSALEKINITYNTGGVLFSVNFNVGYRWIFEGGIALSFGAGIGLDIGEISVDVAKLDYREIQFLRRFFFNIGYVW